MKKEEWAMYSIASCPTTLPVRLSGFHWTTAVSSIPLLPQVLLNGICLFLLQPVHRHAKNATKHKYRPRMTIVCSILSQPDSEGCKTRVPNTPSIVGKARYSAMSQSLANKVRDLRNVTPCMAPQWVLAQPFPPRPGSCRALTEHLRNKKASELPGGPFPFERRS